MERSTAEWSGVEWSGVEWNGVEWSSINRVAFSYKPVLAYMYMCLLLIGR